eukprot:485034-Pelagomonas_calceolata.AAC.1
MSLEQLGLGVNTTTMDSWAQELSISTIFESRVPRAQGCGPSECRKALPTPLSRLTVRLPV